MKKYRRKKKYWTFFQLDFLIYRRAAFIQSDYLGKAWKISGRCESLLIISYLSKYEANLMCTGSTGQLQKLSGGCLLCYFTLSAFLLKGQNFVMTTYRKSSCFRKLCFLNIQFFLNYHSVYISVKTKYTDLAFRETKQSNIKTIMKIMTNGTVQIYNKPSNVAFSVNMLKVITMSN